LPLENKKWISPSVFIIILDDYLFDAS
jgi:hypothetical protein